VTDLIHHLYVRTDTGRLREQNEDSVGQLVLEDGQLVVVADGMGGHQAGDVASQITVREVLNHVAATVGEDPRERLYVAIEKAHLAVKAHANAAGTHDMGCTVVATFVQEGVAHVAHVGDSRLYLLRGGEVSWVTRDHTRVRFLVDAGLLSEEDAEDHPEGNVITRAVGHDPADQDGGFVVDVRNHPIALEAGDSILLCSDGLYDMVSDPETLALVAGRTARAAVDLLVDRANEKDKFGNEPGGYDNITVALMHFGEDVGAGAEFLDADTMKPRIWKGQEAALGGKKSVHSVPPPPAYRPLRSTLVPEETLEDATVTMPEMSSPSAEILQEAGADGLFASVLPPQTKSEITPTLEVARLRRSNIILLAVVVSLLVLTGVLIVQSGKSDNSANESGQAEPGPSSSESEPPSGGSGNPVAPEGTAIQGSDDDDSASEPSGEGAVGRDDDDSAAARTSGDDDDSTSPGSTLGDSE
jgi:protein phosphatase